MRVLSTETMRKLDAYMIGENAIPGLVLMENAAQGVFACCKKIVEPDAGTVHVFCGFGNNGGDGFASARILTTHGYTVKVYLVGKPEKLKGDAKTNAAYFLKSDQIQLIESEDFAVNITKHDIIIDALFGIGLTRNIESVFKAVIDAINQAPCPVVAVDIPSGLNADTGQVMGVSVKADFTVTFQHPKPAHLLQPGKSLCGNIAVQKIGIETGFYSPDDIHAASRSLSPLFLPQRSPNTHKGTYGTLGIVVASDDMYGAGLMCAKATIKSGVGLAHLFVPKNKKDAFTIALPEAIIHTQEDFLSDVYPLTALACGPGLSMSDVAKQLIEKAIIAYPDIPKVLDADALNIIAKRPALLPKTEKTSVLTPHPLEFSRLSGVAMEDVLSDPIFAAQSFAKKFKVVTLLKLATSVAASPSGSVRLIDAGTPGMAKGGSGDVLTGIIGSLLAQRFSLLDATVYGAYIAGTAGEMAAKEKGEHSMSPLDAIDKIAHAIAQFFIDFTEL